MVSTGPSRCQSMPAINYSTIYGTVPAQVRVNEYYQQFTQGIPHCPYRANPFSTFLQFEMLFYPVRHSSLEGSYASDMTNVYMFAKSSVSIFKPVQSTLLLCIGCWSIEALSHSLKTQPSVIRKHVGFWVAQGILKELYTDRFSIVRQQKMVHKGMCVREEFGICNALLFLLLPTRHALQKHPQATVCAPLSHGIITGISIIS